MPASYAHYRFGLKVLPGMPAEVRQCIQRFRRMYEMGLQGPDIFYFYNPLVKNSVTELGGSFHSRSGADFFPAACAQATSEAARAYLYGLLAHYCLDMVCHPFVQQRVDAGEAGHTALEAEFDRYLLELDGQQMPHSFDLSPRLKLTRGECMTVASFYPPATGGNVSISVKNMARFHRFGAGKNRPRREAFLKKVSTFLYDSLIPVEAPEDAILRLDSELLVRFQRAAALYPQLLQQLQDHLRTGAPLGNAFTPDFG